MKLMPQAVAGKSEGEGQLKGKTTAATTGEGGDTHKSPAWRKKDVQKLKANKTR